MNMQKTGIPVFYPKTPAAWRKWLEKNHLSQQSVWLVFYNKQSRKQSLTWSEAVDVALCFGWIDSKKIKIDEETAHQFFSRRKEKSTWSKINKQKVERLTSNGLMTEEGHRLIEAAKQNGWWTILDEVEELILPKDLKDAFRKDGVTKAYFQNLSKSAKKIILQKLVLSRRQETRQRIINELIKVAGQKMQRLP